MDNKFIAIYCTKEGHQLECETLYGEEDEVKKYLMNQKYIIQGIHHILLKRLNYITKKEKHGRYIKDM